MDKTCYLWTQHFFTHADARKSRQTAFFSLIHLLVHRSPSTFPFPLRPFLLLLLPPAPASLPSPLPLRSVYRGILMWPVRELVKLSQLCASGSQGPFSSRRGKPAPAGALLLAACWQINRGGLLFPPPSCIRYFPLTTSPRASVRDQNAVLLEGFGSGLSPYSAGDEMTKKLTGAHGCRTVNLVHCLKALLDQIKTAN